MSNYWHSTTGIPLLTSHYWHSTIDIPLLMFHILTSHFWCSTTDIPLPMFHNRRSTTDVSLLMFYISHFTIDVSVDISKLLFHYQHFTTVAPLLALHNWCSTNIIPLLTKAHLVACIFCYVFPSKETFVVLKNNVMKIYETCYYEILDSSPYI